MADDNTQIPNPEPEKPAAAAPAFDADALAAQVADKLKDQFRSAAPAAQPQPRPAQPVAPDPVGELLAPYVAPVAARAQLDAQAATDAVEFYTTHTDLDREDKQEIERRFNALKEKGVPFKREDIYAHLLGERIDKEVDKRIEKRAKAVARASDAAANVGGGSPDKAGATNLRDANSMSTADLEKAMQGMSF